MNQERKDELRQGPIWRLFDLFGNPLEWSLADRALLIISTTIFFQFLFVILAEHRTAAIETTRDLESIRFFVDWGRHLPWYPLLAIGLWLRKRHPEARWFLWLTCVYWYFTLAVSAWFYAPITAALWISTVGVTLVLLVIVDWPVVISGLLLFFVIVEAGPLLTLLGYESYAPLYSSARSMQPALEVSWWTEAYILLLMMAMVMVFAYIVDRWRLRERSIAEANAELQRLTGELEKSQSELEHRVEERTDELRKANAGLQEEVAKREQIEEELRFTDYSVEHGADAVFWIGSDARIISVNASACEALGYTREELIGESLGVIAPNWYEQDWNSLWARMKRKRQITFETVHQRKDGTRIPVEVKQSYLEFGQTPYLCAFVRDITERKQVEEDRLLLERKLLESQKLESLGVLAGGIAHDFNNMLMTVLGNASLTLMDLDPESQGYQHVKAMETAARRAADLTQQLLAYSGRGAMLQDSVSLNELTREMAELLQVSIGKSVTLNFDFDPDLPAVHADATQMRQVVMNLIVNASEAIGDEPGEIRLRTARADLSQADIDRLRVGEGLAPGEYVKLEVTDGGSGMDATTLERLFDPFFSTKFAGRGLGLAATLGIVKTHRGGLHVHSAVGEGSSFQVFLPVFTGTARPEPPRPEPMASAGRSVGPVSARGPVAVVDDEADVRTATRELLERLGYNVVLFSGGAQLLNYLREHRRKTGRGGPPFFVLLDMTMPEWSGPETFKAMRYESPDVPVILMSGFAEEDAIAQFSGARPAGFLQKPFGMDSLREAIARWIIPRTA